MGNAMGYEPNNAYNLYVHPEITPHPKEEPTFDPLLGFPKGRKPREMKVTEEEMISAKIPLEDRNYCAHLLLAFRTCRRENFPWVVKCEHEKHAYLECKKDDYIIRMKEFERERRLRMKREEIKKRQAVETTLEG